ncbi:MAG: metal-dependent hydrolase [Eubacteriales bacterium]
MDPITHGLTGAALSLFYREAQPKEHEEPVSGQVSSRKAVFWTVVTASVIPDIDYVYRIAGDFTYFKFHRGPTHSIPGIILLALFLSLVLSRVFPGMKKLALFGWSLLGLTFHVSLDLLNTYSTYALWPFSPKPLSFDILMIIDPILWVILAAGIILSRLKRMKEAGRKIALSVFLLLTLYVGTRVYVHWDLEHSIARQFNGVSPERIAVIPGLFGISSWNYIIESPKEYVMGSITYPRHLIRESRRLTKEGGNDFINKALGTEVGRVLSYFTPFLYVKTQPEGDRYVVTLSDLRYSYNDSFGLTARIILNKNHQVVSETFKPFHK